MAMTVHTVRSGESLSTIAKKVYGAAHLWPSIYSATNRLASQHGSRFRHIRDPNRIKAGDRLAIPNIPGPARNQMANDNRLRAAVPVQLTPAAAGPPAPAVPASPHPRASLAPLRPAASDAGSGGPADHVPLAPFYGWVFKLDDIGLYETAQNGLKLTVKFKGEVTVQPKEGTPLVKLSNRDGEMDMQREAETVMGRLLTDYQFAYDAKANRLKFTCKMTQAGHAGAPDIGFGVPTAPDILLEFLKFKPFKGSLGGHAFLVNGLTVELTISRDQTPSPPNQPTAALAPAEARRSLLSSIDWTQVTVLTLLGVLSIGCLFFGGFALAATAAMVGIGGVLLWNHAEARERSGPVGGARGLTAYPDAIVLPEITVYGHPP